ncbi:3-methyladenine DNA glycosylase [[Mycobacterium] burgundiense]|uniref:3-methyladenine DNA glycosylase n=1 Tax=[Mycobacterium] burgundiense TaxID=3064286 RepID=A0ABN9NDJ0_9MYCO|nr:3-methyladenine DNA glycosylase [Mycolicibacterium sp. MU0053]CAJ1503073.1 3-methyladenine DNA glycosylase [Mycolicibacterium sp. MU0053]
MTKLLPESVWTAAAGRHRARVQRFLADHSGDGQPHPVWDFLFTYYSLRPRQLLRWHPGYGAVLTGAAAGDYVGRTGYHRVEGGVTVSVAYRDSRLDTIEFIADLLSATAGRPAQHHCFGLHEWAMVYRSNDVRHRAVPLRLGQSGTDAVVDSMPLRCSHYDAYRFFTDPAAPRNATRLTRDAQRSHEQPGCVHTNMDLYKWTYKLLPLLDSTLLLDCLELAAAARALDMRASPYDLRDYGLDPIRIEEPAGRAEYVRLQSAISERSKPLRATLIDRCRDLSTGAKAGDFVARTGYGNIGAASG